VFLVRCREFQFNPPRILAQMLEQWALEEILEAAIQCRRGCLNLEHERFTRPHRGVLEDFASHSKAVAAPLARTILWANLGQGERPAIPFLPFTCRSHCATPKRP
jgi:hypothetical protein